MVCGSHVWCTRIGKEKIEPSIQDRGIRVGEASAPGPYTVGGGASSGGDGPQKRWRIDEVGEDRARFGLPGFDDEDEDRFEFLETPEQSMDEGGHLRATDGEEWMNSEVDA